MASEAQVRANRLNAQQSTGPRTAEGKAAVAQNAVKHGLRAAQIVIKGEDPGQFESYRDAVLAELAPAGSMETMLAQRIAGLAWRLQRAERLQSEVFDALLAKETARPLAKLTRSLQAKSAADDPGDDLALGRAVVKDFGNSRVLDRLGLYERRIEHSLYKTMAELQRLQLLRELESAPAEPARPPAPKPLRQTKPISPAGRPSTSSQARARADKRRSCLTAGAGFEYDPALRTAGGGTDSSGQRMSWDSSQNRRRNGLAHPQDECHALIAKDCQDGDNGSQTLQSRSLQRPGGGQRGQLHRPAVRCY